MADSDRPPHDGGFDDPGPDEVGSGESVAEDSGEWMFDDTGEWTEPMPRTATDPFGTPVRPACEPPGESALVPDARRAAGRPGRPGMTGTGMRIGAIGGLVTTVAVAASLVLLGVAPDAPRESRDVPREPRWFPISELAGPAASFEPGEPAAAGVIAPLASPVDEPAGSAICEIDLLAPPLVPAPTLPASDPAPARDDAALTGDDAASTMPDESARGDEMPDKWMQEIWKPNRGAGGPDDEVGDQRRLTGSETPGP